MGRLSGEKFYNVFDNRKCAFQKSGKQKCTKIAEQNLRHKSTTAFPILLIYRYNHPPNCPEYQIRLTTDWLQT